LSSSASERWRPVPVPEFATRYQVSDHGNVRSLPRKHVPRLRALKQCHSTDGYPMVSLSRPDKHKTFVIHKLVAHAFLGEQPPGSDIRHLDGDKWNNHIDNLVYGTRSENYLDMVAHGTHNMARKTHCPKGHPYDASNTYLAKRKNGVSRMCKTCTRNRTRENQRRRNGYYDRHPLPS